MLATTARSSVDQDFLRYVGELSASWQTSGRLLERRDGHRIRFTATLRLEPLDDSGRLLPPAEGGGPVLVQCRDISQQGISFRHAQPLPFRTVALTFDVAELPPASPEDLAGLETLLRTGTAPDAPPQPIRLTARLRWCR